LLAASILVNPFFRQTLFGPRIGGVPLCYWQDAVRYRIDPSAYGDSFTSKVTRWLGVEETGTVCININGPDMLPVFESLADDPNPRVRQEIANWLGSPMWQGKSRPVLVRLLDDPEPTVRAAATRSLGTPTIDPK
jgi:hypothetical protein